MKQHSPARTARLAQSWCERRRRSNRRRLGRMLAYHILGRTHRPQATYEDSWESNVGRH